MVIQSSKLLLLFVFASFQCKADVYDNTEYDFSEYNPTREDNVPKETLLRPERVPRSTPNSRYSDIQEALRKIMPNNKDFFSILTKTSQEDKVTSTDQNRNLTIVEYLEAIRTTTNIDYIDIDTEIESNGIFYRRMPSKGLDVSRTKDAEISRTKDVEMAIVMSRSTGPLNNTKTIHLLSSSEISALEKEFLTNANLILTRTKALPTRSDLTTVSSFIDEYMIIDTTKTDGRFDSEYSGELVIPTTATIAFIYAPSRSPETETTQVLISSQTKPIRHPDKSTHRDEKLSVKTTQKKDLPVRTSQRKKSPVKSSTSKLVNVPGSSIQMKAIHTPIRSTWKNATHTSTTTYIHPVRPLTRPERTRQSQNLRKVMKNQLKLTHMTKSHDSMEYLKQVNPKLSNAQLMTEANVPIKSPNSKEAEADEDGDGEFLLWNRVITKHAQTNTESVDWTDSKTESEPHLMKMGTRQGKETTTENTDVTSSNDNFTTNNFITKTIPESSETTTQTTEATTTTVSTTTQTTNATTTTVSTTTQTTEATTTTTVSTTPGFDVDMFLEILANLTYDYDTNLTMVMNMTLKDRGAPTCGTPKGWYEWMGWPNFTWPTASLSSTTSTTTEPYIEPVRNLNNTVVAKCFVCGLKESGIPYSTDCADAFAGDFLPLVPVNPLAKAKAASYRKYCRYGEIYNYHENKTRPKSIYGRWTGGCSVRWTDLTGLYTQRACRNRRRPTTGKHYASKRMAKLEFALSSVEDGCIITPAATLLPVSRGVSLYSRFHACVCTGNWCNMAAALLPHVAVTGVTALAVAAVWSTLNKPA